MLVEVVSPPCVAVNVRVCVFAVSKSSAVAVAEISVDIDEVSNMKKGQVAVAKSVLMPTGIYPQNWSKQNFLNHFMFFINPFFCF